MKIAFLFLAFALVAVAHASDYNFKEPFTQSAPFNANGAVTLSNVNGSVTIKTWDKNEILIEGEKSAKTAEELKLIDLAMDIAPARVTIKTSLPKRPGFWHDTIRAAVRFTITVPANAVLEKIASVNAAIDLDGVRGTVHAESVNGGIHATNLAASAHLETVNGSIHAAFTSIAKGQKIDAKTVNGRIDLSLPQDAGASLQADVVNGNVHCDFPLTLGQSSRGRHLEGKIGDGRATVTLESVNGSIRIASR